MGSSDTLAFDPSTIKLLGARILVRKYEKPESVKGIIIPDEYRADDTNSLWEAVAWTEKALDVVNGLTARIIEEDDILQTRPWRGEQLPPSIDPSGRHFILDAHEIINLIKW